MLFNKIRRHKEFKATSDYNIYNKFSRLRALCKKEFKTSYLRFLQKIQNDLTSNRKSFFHNIKSLRVDNDIPNTVVLNEKSSTGWSAVAELFKQLFSSVYSTNSLNIN